MLSVFCNYFSLNNYKKGINNSVNIAKRMINAISLHVFWRIAPSTKVIIISRKLLPVSLVTISLILSDHTLAAPVTNDLSLSDSRITGALSQVMSLKAIVVKPTMISLSVVIKSPASKIKTSPFFNLEELIFLFSPLAKTVLPKFIHLFSLYYLLVILLLPRQNPSDF